MDGAELPLCHGWNRAGVSVCAKPQCGLICWPLLVWKGTLSTIITLVILFQILYDKQRKVNARIEMYG